MDRVVRLETRFAEILPEDLLIRVGARGLKIGIQPDEEELSSIFESIKKRRPVLLFPWFWTHEDVVNFSKRFFNTLTPDDVLWYLRLLHAILGAERELHWMERVNLFHAFGLARLVGGDELLRVIEQDYGYGMSKQASMRTLTDVSAYNVIAMLRFSSPMDSITILRLLEDSLPTVISFGKYQVYYYGGLANLLDIMQDYLDDRKIVLVPQSVASLLFLAELDKTRKLESTSRAIHDVILPQLPSPVVSAIEHLVSLSR